MADGADERLVVMLEARISEFEKRMRRAEGTGTNSYNRLRRGSRGATAQMEADMNRSTNRINQALATTSTRIGSFAKSFAAGFAGGIVATAFSAFNSNVNATIKGIAQIGDEAKRSGLGLETFQEWKFVAEQNRIGIDALVDGFKELNLRADEFIVTGGGSAAEAFKRLGFGADELKGKLKDPSALMLEIIGRLEGIDKAAQIRIADELFGGTGGEQFVQLLDQGEAGIRKIIDRAHEVGSVMDEEMIKQADEVSRKYDELTTRASNWAKATIVGLVAAGAELADFRWKLDEIFENEDEGRSILGDGVYDALEKDRDALDEVAEDVNALKGQYESLALEVIGASHQLSAFADELDRMGLSDQARIIREYADGLRTTGEEYRQGTIDGQEFADKIATVQANAETAFSALEDVDGVTFGGVMAELGRLGAVIGGLIELARTLRGALPGAGVGTDTGTPLSGDVGQFMPPTFDSGMPTSRRPNWRENTVDLGDNGDSGGRGKKGGGGRGGDRGLTSLISDLMTPIEEIEAWHEEAMKVLNGATEEQLKALGGKNEAIERLEQEHADRLRAIDLAKNDQRLGEAADFFGAMAGLAAQGGDKLVKVTRVFGAMEAFLNTKRAQAQVLADPTLGWWGKMAAYASIGAAGLGVVNAIRGGGGGGGSSGGGATATPQAAAAAPTINRDMYVNISGTLGRESTRELIEQINEGLKDGYRLVGMEYSS